MGEIVLGTSRIHTKPRSVSDKLFNEALKAGILGFDTAPSYPGSEDRISSWIKGRLETPKLKVSTKLGLRELTSTKSLSIALKRIQSLYSRRDVKTIFIHSIPTEKIDQKVLKEFVSLRDKGEINEIGYSGDGLNLMNAIQNYKFDAVMCTVNPIDNSNLDVLKSVHFQGDVYAKRVMANYAWSLSNTIKTDFLKRPNWVVSEYRTRIKKYLPENSPKKLPEDFLTYSLRHPIITYSVLGISSESHLRFLLQLQDKILRSNSPIPEYAHVREEPIT